MPSVIVRFARNGLLLTLAIVSSPGISGQEIALTIGTGEQPGGSQTNTTSGFEYTFYTLERSSRQHLRVGVAYTRLKTDFPSQQSLYAINVYPELMFYPQETSWLAQNSPAWFRPHFFVRALGPGYISSDTLGDRSQANSFAFLAQIGAGMSLGSGEGSGFDISVSWKHFSNAGLFDPNDGIDVPFVVRVGYRFR